MTWAQATKKTVMEETNDNPQRSNDNRQVTRHPSNQSGVYEQYGFNQSNVYNDYHDRWILSQSLSEFEKSLHNFLLSSLW